MEDEKQQYFTDVITETRDATLKLIEVRAFGTNIGNIDGTWGQLWPMHVQNDSNTELNVGDN